LTVVVPELAVEYGELVARRVHGRAAKVRWSFIRGTKPSPPPMTRMLRGGRGGAVRLKLYLSFLWFAANPPYDVTYPARAWAGLMGLADPEGNGARRVVDAISWLEHHRFVEAQRRRGRPSRVVLLAEDGSGAPYRPPHEALADLRESDSVSDEALRENYWVQLPADFWRNGWVAVLSGPAVAMLLAILSDLANKPEFTEVWFSPFLARERFGLSEDTRTAGMRQLRDLQLVDVRRRSVSHDAFDFRRMRNTYVLDKARFAKRPDE